MTPSAGPVTVALALITLSLSAAQFWYKTGIDVAGFTVTVLNRTGELVADLEAEDFDVQEDGTNKRCRT